MSTEAQAKGMGMSFFGEHPRDAMGRELDFVDGRAVVLPLIRGLEPADISDIVQRHRSGEPEYVIAAHYAVPADEIVETLRQAVGVA